MFRKCAIFWANKNINWTFRADHKFFKTVRTGTDIPCGGSDWADKLLFGSLCC